MNGKRFFRLVASVVLTIVVVGSVAADLPRWASSFGVDSPYEPPEYLAGFGVAGREAADQREAARQQALAALAEKIQVRVRSEIVAETRDTGDDVRTSLTNVVNTSSDIQIQDVRYEYAQERGSTYVLAYARIETIEDQYVDEAAEIVSSFVPRLDRLENEIERGNVQGARQIVGELRADLETLAGFETVWRALRRLQSAYQEGTRTIEGGSVRWPHDPAGELFAELLSREERIITFRPTSELEAARYLAGQIVAPELQIGAVTPFIFQDSDFSSQFGLRFARLLESELAWQQRPGSEPRDVVLRGLYWVDNEEVSITITVRDVTTGRAVTGASVALPIGAVRDQRSLQPANSREAMEAGAALLGDAVTDGGLRIEAWCDRGSMQDVPVYEDGDFVQFYFRVNQPAFLRLSYQLATGEVVLLESQFYIGVDRVNRPVELPYRFQVVPPYGVERLIVTGYNVEPPAAATRIAVIDGQQYEVYASAIDAVAPTRGIVREQRDDSSGTSTERVGEATMSLTTVARE